MRAGKALVAPVVDAVRSARSSGLYPLESASISAATATEFVLVVAAEALDRLDEGLPRSPTRSWLADDEVADLGGRLEPLHAAPPAELVTQIEVEFAAISSRGE